MRGSNVQGFVSTVRTLYEEEEEKEKEEDFAPLYGYRHMRSSIFYITFLCIAIHNITLLSTVA